MISIHSNISKMPRNLKICAFFVTASLISLAAYAQPTPNANRGGVVAFTNPPGSCNASNTMCYMIRITRTGTAAPKAAVYDSTGANLVPAISVEPMKNTGNNPTTIKWFIDRDSYPNGVSNCKFTGSFNDANTADDPWQITKITATSPLPISDQVFPIAQRKIGNNTGYSDSVVEVTNHNKNPKARNNLDKFDYLVRVNCKVDGASNVAVDTDPSVDNWGEN